MSGLTGGFFVGDIMEIKPLKANKIALYDADYLKYILTSRLFKARENGEYATFDLDGRPFVEGMIKDLVGDILYKIKDPIIFCFSGKSYSTFRNSVSFEKKYKGNREGKSDPYYYDEKAEDMASLVSYFNKNQPTLLFNDLEADDILSSLQDENTYIVSKDKDLKQVAGTHYDFDSNTVYEIPAELAFHNLCLQLLSGDTVDNIPGLPRVGEKTAVKILDGVPKMNKLPTIINEYQKKFGVIKGTDAFVETWNLVKMRENRGTYYKEKYARMFDLKELILKNLMP